MGVVPEESNGRSHHRATKDGQLADLGHALQFQIGRKGRMPADVGEHGQGSRRDHGATDCQTV